MKKSYNSGTDGMTFFMISGILMFSAFFGAWVTNLVWLMQNGFGDWGGEVVVSLFGIFFIPVGIIHGMYLWF